MRIVKESSSTEKFFSRSGKIFPNSGNGKVQKIPVKAQRTQISRLQRIDKVRIDIKIPTT